jgi:hypothetical protein
MIVGGSLPNRPTIKIAGVGSVVRLEKGTDADVSNDVVGVQTLQFSAMPF